jgi:exopolysaccharide production protein ExoZ
LRRRIVRVVPLYWMLTLLMVGLALLLPGLFKSLQVAPDTLVKSLLFIPHFSSSFPHQVWPLLVPGWTLNFEMYFYLLFGLSLLLPARARLAALVLLLVASVASGILLRPLTSAAGRTYTDFKLLEFAAGALIGHMWHVGRIRLPLAASLIFIVLGFVLLVGATALPGNLGRLLGASAVIFGALQPRIVESRNSLLLLLGNASYSIYLTHLFSLGVMRWLWVRVMPATLDIPSAAAFMGLAMIVAAIGGQVAFLLLEKPMLDWFRKRRQPARLLAAEP